MMLHSPFDSSARTAQGSPSLRWTRFATSWAATTARPRVANVCGTSFSTLTSQWPAACATLMYFMEWMGSNMSAGARGRGRAFIAQAPFVPA